MHVGYLREVWKSLHKAGWAINSYTRFQSTDITNVSSVYRSRRSSYCDFPFSSPPSTCMGFQTSFAACISSYSWPSCSDDICKVGTGMRLGQRQYWAAYLFERHCIQFLSSKLYTRILWHLVEIYFPLRKETHYICRIGSFLMSTEFWAQEIVKSWGTKLVDSYPTSHNHLPIDASQLANFYVTAIDACTIYVDSFCVSDVQRFWQLDIRKWWVEHSAGLCQIQRGLGDRFGHSNEWTTHFRVFGWEGWKSRKVRTTPERRRFKRRTIGNTAESTCLFYLTFYSTPTLSLHPNSRARWPAWLIASFMLGMYLCSHMHNLDRKSD